MRITNSRKNELQQIINDTGLSLDDFDISGQNEIYEIRFTKNYFEFLIKKERANQYYSTYKTISSKASLAFQGGWEKMLPIYTKWLIDIKEDMNYEPKKLIKEERKFSTVIKKMSSRFIRIYNQANIAEQNNLSEICGLGYRKAFEILLKDYLIKKNPEEEHETIRTMMVSQCIAKYVTSDEIKLLSHRVFWLGNDHAHYTKKWNGKTLSDLKKLINLAVNWIEIHEELLRVQKEMPKRK